MQNHVCPPSVARWLNSPIRTFFENPKRLFGKLVKPGDVAVDLGCGGGVFSVALAKMVGPEGRVIAVDFQPVMLEMTRELAAKKGVLDRITLHRCEVNDLGLEEVAADCVLAIHVVHETPDAQHFVRQAAALVKPGGHLLLLEPYFHVSKADFEETRRAALESGLRRVETGGPLGSRSVLLVRE